MPIEIRELVIKVTVHETAQQTAGGGEIPEETLLRLKERLVRECTEAVLEKMRMHNER